MKILAVLSLLVGVVLAIRVAGSEEAVAPIVQVAKERYLDHPTKATAINVAAYYVGPGLEREEVHSWQAVSDTPEKPKRRRSPDNGRTWSAFEPVPDIVTQEHGARVYWGGGAPFYDPVTEVSVCIWLRQTYVKKTYHNQCFSRVSQDNGRTWSAPRPLRYEDGAAFDPANPLDPDFLEHNQAYVGNNIIRHTNGTLIHCGASVNVPYVNEEGQSYHPWFPADAKNIGSVCFIGTWDPEGKDYEWTAGNPVWVPLKVSSRGLLEPEVAELEDGRVLVIWRGSDSPITPGRKWFSVSEDGGLTLSPVAELRYDDGSRFYSPSSFHRMLRSRVTNKLYWFGNICPNPPSGNSPRYPLIMAEMDETIPALKRNTVTVIDGRGPGDDVRLQLSNFSLLENRETGDIEIYLTRLGADPNDFWASDAYKYTLSFP